MATYEEASACPKCGNSGNLRITRPQAEGYKLLTFYCENHACKWYDTPWNVTVKPDGTIPDAHEHRGEKQYVGFDADDRLARELMTQLEELNKQSLQGRVNPFGG